MINTGVLLACVVYMIAMIVDLNDHNKKLDKYFPDQDDRDQYRAASDLRISLYGHYLLLIGMIIVLILETIRSFT